MSNEIYEVIPQAETLLSAATGGAATPEKILSAVCAALADLDSGGFGQAYVPAGIATDGELAVNAHYTDDNGVEVRYGNMPLTRRV